MFKASLSTCPVCGSILFKISKQKHGEVISLKSLKITPNGDMFLFCFFILSSLDKNKTAMLIQILLSFIPNKAKVYRLTDFTR